MRLTTRGMRLALALIAGALWMASASAEADLSQPKHTVIPLVEQGPVLDGKLDDACWTKASRLTNFLNQERLSSTVNEQTFVWAACDRDNLYFGFKCLAKDPAKTIAEKTGHDAQRAYKDDVVEIMLDTGHTQNDCFHFIINSVGAIWDAEEHRLPETERMIASPQWDSGAEAKGSRDKEAWYVEIRIPLKDLGGKAVKSVAEEGTWGLQIGRENWSGGEMSTWSRTYTFREPKDFGVAAFVGKPVWEGPVVWEQAPDKDFQPTTWPPRHTYEFQRIFVFGPEKDGGGEPVTVVDPADVNYVHPGMAYAADTGYGFSLLEKPLAAAGRGRGYGTGYSPLVKQFIASREPAVFLFDLPKGEYQAVFTSGAANDYFAPTDTRIAINGAALRIENPVPYRVFLSKSVAFAAAGATPVKVAVSSSPGMAWLLTHALIYPAADEAQAAPAFDSFQRDFFNYPVEEKVYKKAKVWIEYPAAAESFLTDEEKRAGFAVVNLPSAHFTPRNYVPQKEDSRGPARAISSPGERTAIQIGFYAIQSVSRLDVRLGPDLPTGISAQLMATKYTARNIGRGALNQWGYEPRTLWPAATVYKLPAGRMQPYYLILDIADDAKPGVYPGTVEFLLDGRAVAKREWRLTVLPFRPRNKRFIWSMFYTPVLATHGWDGFTDQEKDALMRVDRTYLRDLKRHGIDYVTAGSFRESYVKDNDGRWHFRPGDRDVMFLRLLKENGVSLLSTSLLGFEPAGYGAFILNEDLVRQGEKPITAMPDRYRCQGKLSPALFENLTELTREQIAFYRSQNTPAPPFFLWDEPGDINSPALAPLLDAIHKGGGRTHVTLVAGCFPALHGRVDVRDYNGIALGIPGGEAESPAQIRATKRQDGSKYVVYQNGTIMGSDPRQARFGFGYWAWAWDLDGLNPWKYWKINGDPLVSGASFHPLVLDSSDHIMVTTTSWEMHAEGVYDSKLVQMLADLVAGKSSPAAVEAARFLNDLKQKSALGFDSAAHTTSPLTGAPVTSEYVWPACRYDLLRAQLVERLLKLTGADDPAIAAEVAAVAKQAADRDAAQRERRYRGLPAARKGNLVVHGDGEDLPFGNKAPEGFVRWSPRASIEGDVVHAGKGAIRFVHDQAFPNDTVTFPTITLEPRRTYVFRAWAKRQAEGGEVARPSGFWLHTWGDEGRKKPFVRRLLVPFGQARPSFDWRQYEYTFTAEPEERSLEIWVYFVDPKATVYVDDVELLELAD